MHKKKCKPNNSTIVKNKKALYSYFIKREFEAGLSLQGWEVKSLRSKNVNISNSYILLKHGEAYLIGAMFQPQIQLSFGITYDPIRTRKLLLKKHELNFLFGQVNREGYTIIPLSMYWENIWVKVKIGIAQGKKQHDKRIDMKKREWQRDKARIRITAK